MILRDPVHGLVAFEADEDKLLVALLETAEIQRLRRIRQLGFTSLSYPGADHTRFSHSVGTAYVMGRFLNRYRELHEELPFWQRITTERAREALAAALLHDLGHGPFSHLFENAVESGPRHEEWSCRIVLDPSTEVHRVLARFDSGLPHRVAELICGRHEVPFLGRTVSGTFDADRCDYLLRDAYFTGVDYGRFDLEWLLRSLRLGLSEDGQVPQLLIDGTKGLPAIESFVLARLFMFQQVYFHKASRASEWMLTKILQRVQSLILDGTSLPALPPALVDFAQRQDTSLGEYLRLDDFVLWESLRAWQSARDPVLRDLSCRLFNRQLFKTHELFGEQLDSVWNAEALAITRSVAAEHGYDPDWYVGLDVATDTPYEEENTALRVQFPGGRQRPPGEVSMVLRRLNGEAVERVRLIFPQEIRAWVVEALEQ